MVNTIITNFDIWTTAQTIKSNGRSISVDNQKQHGIDKLRGLILELAVHGKLVPQDPNDEPASELLKKISKEKERLIKEGEIKKQEPLPKIGEVEKPYELPEGWNWVRLGQTGLGSTGKTPSTGILEYYNGEIPFLGPGQITPEGKIIDSDKTLTKEGCEYSSIADSGDILMVCIGGSIGKSAIVKSKVTFNQQINCIRPLVINTAYLNFAMNAPFFQALILANATGSATPIINRYKWEGLLISLPPLAEQHRIVAKVDELMALCDQLEQLQTNSNAAHHTLVETLLGTLTNAAGQVDFEASWQRIANHFDALFTTEFSIDQLKQTILQLAVMGKLVEQDPNDEPASELLKRIAKEKERLVKMGKIKKQEKFEEIGKEYKTIEIPVNWSLTRLGDLIFLVSGQHLKPEEYADSMQIGMVPYLTGPAEFGDQFPSPTRYTSERRALAIKGDILITCKGSGVGKLNIADTEIAISRQLMAIRPIDGNPQFLKLLAESLNEFIREKIVGIAIPGISREDITESIVKLPPLAEQHRIVAKVDELFAICDALKERIKDAQHIQVQLAEAVVEGVLG